MAEQLLNPSTVAGALQVSSSRNQKETAIKFVMLACAAFSILITVGIVLILLETAVLFFTDSLFLDISIMQEMVRDLAQQVDLPTEELQRLLARAVNAEDRTFRLLSEPLGLSEEMLRQEFDQRIGALGGFEAFWRTLTTSLSRFFLDTRWTPLFGSKRFGIWPLVNGTLMVAMVAMSVAVPAGTLTALYLGLYAPKKLAQFLRPMVEVLAGIPTVVYGYFALIYVTPIIQNIFSQTPIFNVLSAGIMMGIMIIPTVGSISLDSLNAVPQELHNGAYALGATRMEVATQIVFPAAISGVAASIILGISRAVGETMIVTIACGQQPVSYEAGFFGALGSVFNPLQSMATMTAYIAQVSLGDSPFGSIEYETLFAVGAVLFSITLSLNIISREISKRIRIAYE